jgi:hypothetical protein
MHLMITHDVQELKVNPLHQNGAEQAFWCLGHCGYQMSCLWMQKQ